MLVDSDVKSFLFSRGFSPALSSAFFELAVELLRAVWQCTVELKGTVVDQYEVSRQLLANLEAGLGF